jgi:hypothetical protein
MRRLVRTAKLVGLAVLAAASQGLGACQHVAEIRKVKDAVAKVHAELGQ